MNEQEQQFLNSVRDAEPTKVSKPSPKKKWESTTQMLYGITSVELAEMKERQGYRCLICGKHESDCHQSLSVDHDHKCCPGKKSCGKCIRGLLCQSCNSMLGQAKDDVVILKNAVIYLNNYRG